MPHESTVKQHIPSEIDTKKIQADENIGKTIIAEEECELYSNSESPTL